MESQLSEVTNSLVTIGAVPRTVRVFLALRRIDEDRRNVDECS